IAVKFPSLDFQSENPLAQCINVVVDSNKITRQIVTDSTEPGLFRVISVPARAHRTELRPEVEDGNTDSNSADQVMSIIVKVGNIKRRTMKIHGRVKPIIFEPVVLLGLLYSCNLGFKRRMLS